MSEKRFTLVGGKSKFNEILVKVYDNFEEEVIEKQKVVDLLNEQQATNDYLEEANSRLQIQLGETLRLVDEQQATIGRLKNAIRIAYEEKPYPTLEDIQDKYKELEDE